MSMPVYMCRQKMLSLACMEKRRCWEEWNRYNCRPLKSWVHGIFLKMHIPNILAGQWELKDSLKPEHKAIGWEHSMSEYTIGMFYNHSLDRYFGSGMTSLWAEWYLYNHRNLPISDGRVGSSKHLLLSFRSQCPYQKGWNTFLPNQISGENGFS